MTKCWLPSHCGQSSDLSYAQSDLHGGGGTCTKRTFVEESAECSLSTPEDSPSRSLGGQSTQLPGTAGPPPASPSPGSEPAAMPGGAERLQKLRFNSPRSRQRYIGVKGTIFQLTKLLRCSAAAPDRDEGSAGSSLGHASRSMGRNAPPVSSPNDPKSKSSMRRSPGLNSCLKAAEAASLFRTASRWPIA